MSYTEFDPERFRLRSFVRQLGERDELDTVGVPLSVCDLACHWDGNEKAVYFTTVGGERTEVVANVMAARSRLAAAFEVSEQDLLAELLNRISTPQDVVEVDRQQAPVQSIVKTGDDADFLSLPIPFQHALDGGPYLSSTIDVTVNPATGLTNAGCRRMMITGRRTAGVDVTAPSDLRAIYEGCAARGEKLPVSFVLGAHPTVHMAATLRVPGDETELMARLRGAPMAVVKCITNDIRVPVDAEIILEGYFDEKGYASDEGPYGEYMGYYGLMKQNPVFHLTAITMRQDALFQTSTISGRTVRLTDSGQMGALRTETIAWRALQSAIREPVAIYATSAQNIRLSMRPRVPGEARNAIACLFGCLANVKNVYVVDDDIDIFDDRQIDWCMATRFQADRDLIVEGGFRTVPIDPSLYGARTGAKAGFDLTIQPDKKKAIAFTVSEPPHFEQSKRFETIAEALSDGPKTFQDLMAALGTREARDLIPELEELRQTGKLARGPDGEFKLKRKP